MACVSENKEGTICSSKAPERGYQFSSAIPSQPQQQFQNQYNTTEKRFIKYIVTIQ